MRSRIYRFVVADVEKDVARKTKERLKDEISRMHVIRVSSCLTDD